MVICPEGHESAATDFCDRCGLLIEPPPAPRSSAPGVDEHEVSSATQVRHSERPGEPCPQCQTPRQEGARFCEVDGYDFEDATPIQTVWRITVRADRSRFDGIDADDLVFPADAPVLTFTLGTDSVSLGRRSAAGVPDVDLGGTYDDPGVSRRHLRFVRRADGGYAVVDCGSANGTTVDDDPQRLAPDTPVDLQDGTRIHLGAWTTITVERQVSAG
jgi:hypothetical protein